MDAREAAPSRLPATGRVSVGRFVSIDIFRGLTVLVMVFVDNLDFVKGLPWWTYHLPREANGMTYVDMVFPAFLFVMGMSIPLAVERRIAEGDSRGKIWRHIIARSLSLVTLGLFIANGPQVDRQQAGMSAVSWCLLGFAGIALFWGAGPSPASDKRLHRILKYAGLLLLAVLATIFRRTTPDSRAAWLDFSDWEILDLLGWAYLLASCVYLVFRKNVVALAASLLLLVGLNVVATEGWFAWLHGFPPYVQPFEAGLTSITVAGLLASLIVFDGTGARSFKAKSLSALGYAAVLAFGGWALTPLGISKLRDTPAWCLYCAAANTLVLLILYWIADVKHWTRWAGFITVAGRNALLAYLLAYVAYFTPTLFRLTADGTEGWYGVMRSFLFAALVLSVTIVLSRLKFRIEV
jgi:heparan-alpha-glucosaminide N-acetyltransferase